MTTINEQKYEEMTSDKSICVWTVDHQKDGNTVLNGTCGIEYNANGLSDVYYKYCFGCGKPMKKVSPLPSSSHRESIRRRAFLKDMGLGFGSVALASMLHRDAPAATSDKSRGDGLLHFAPKAKSVIWLFMIGGTSHLESFDPKLALNRMVVIIS